LTLCFNYDSKTAFSTKTPEVKSKANAMLIFGYYWIKNRPRTFREKRIQTSRDFNLSNFNLRHLSREVFWVGKGGSGIQLVLSY
jgi:hypothetical protein